MGTGGSGPLARMHTFAEQTIAPPARNHVLSRNITYTVGFGVFSRNTTYTVAFSLTAVSALGF